MLIVYILISNLFIRFILSKELSYKSYTCTRSFFKCVLLQPLDTDLVQTNNKCIHTRTHAHIHTFDTGIHV